ncbi:ankyrin repeat-containing domain protein, partial [Pilobolus umbonatus]
MPSLFTRTFALLNNTKPPVLEDPADLSNADVTLFEQEIVRHTYTSTPEITIWKAAEIGDIAAVQYYLDESNGLDASTLVNTRDPDTDCTLLHIIASSGQKHTSPEQSVVYLFEMMIKHGADVTARNVYNVQAIHMVALHCPEPYLPMKLLLNHGASPNARDGDAWTPLHYAARFCHPPDKVVQLLVSRGADVNLLDATNKTAIFSLLANGDHTDLFDWFIHKAKSDISVQGDFLDKTSRQTRVCTILTQIAKYGRMDCMLLILRSPEAIRQLSRVVTQSELDYAMALAKD